MMSARGSRTRLSIASTTGIRASAKNRLIPTSRMTPRTRHARYRNTAVAAMIMIIRTTPPGEGAARRTTRASAGARRLGGCFAVAVVELPLELVAGGVTEE